MFKQVSIRTVAIGMLFSASMLASSAVMAAEDTLSRIARSGVVRIGYIPTPGTFAFQNGAGETVGYSIDICNRFIENIRLELKRKDLRIQYQAVAAADRIPLLREGLIDAECGGNTNTVARQKDVDFSFTFFTTGVRFLVKKPFDVERPESLWEKTVAVTNGTTAADVVTRLKVEQRVDVVLVGSDDEGVRLVETGKAHAFAQDDVLLYGLIARAGPKSGLAVSGKFQTVEPYAFMLPKGDLALRQLADKTFIQLVRSGELMDIYRKWFDTERLRIPMNVYMKENLKFPSRYGIP